MLEIEKKKKKKSKYTKENRHTKNCLFITCKQTFIRTIVITHKRGTRIICARKFLELKIDKGCYRCIGEISFRKFRFTKIEWDKYIILVAYKLVRIIISNNIERLVNVSSDIIFLKLNIYRTELILTFGS